MPTFWFSYSTVFGIDAPEPPNSPYTITWHLGRFLRDKLRGRGYELAYRNLDDVMPANVQSDDIIMAHSWYPRGFMTETLNCKVRARFLLQPYQHDIVGRNESWWIKKIADACDHLFFVTGPYWWDTMHEGLYGDWKEKATRLDMAVNPGLHPHSKKHWNAPGKRKFLAIGADIPYKGLDMIADLARIGGFHLGYFGAVSGEKFQHVPQFQHNGARDFTPDVQAWIANEYDAFISLARGDANPTTLLETACWGLLPMCNQESGYWPDKPFVELRKDDTLFNLAQIDWLQSASEYELRQRAEQIRCEVIERHGWARFYETVWSGLEPYL